MGSDLAPDRRERGGGDDVPGLPGWLGPAALFGLAFGVRGIAAWRTAVIFNDGPSYLEVAARFHAGEWTSALGHAYHPLYPALTAIVAPWVGDFARAGVLVSVVAGSAAVLGLYAFLAHAFSRRVAVLGGLLLALHPYAVRFSSNVQSEGLYLAFFLAAVALSWRAVQESAALPAAGAGALAGAAYLVRPEGLGLVAAALAFSALRLFQGRTSVPDFLRVSGALAAGALFLAGPYLVQLHGDTGEWMLTRKKSVGDLVTPADDVPIPAPGSADRPRFRPPALRRPAAREASLLPARLDFEPRAVSAAVDLALVSASALHPAVLLLVGLAAVRRHGPPGERGRFLLLVTGLYGVVFYGLALNVGYLDRRHVLPPLLPLLGYAALGLPVLGRALLRVLRPRRDPRDAAAALWLGIAFFALATLPKTWAAHDRERLATRRAAEWLAAREDLSGPVAAEKHRTAWYAGEAFVHLARGGSHGDVDALVRAGARFLIVDDAQTRERPALEARRARLAELHRESVAGRTAWVYELAPAPRGAGL